MVNGATSPKDASPGPSGVRRAYTSIDESRQQHPSSGRQPGIADSLGGSTRRRSSNFSDFSLNEARKQFQASTDDLLLPRPSLTDKSTHNGTTHWHSAPLAFALLPALGGMVFKNGSSVVTDVMLLGIAAIFLNWSVRLPWDWYHSAQELRIREEYDADAVIDEESGDEIGLDASQASLDDVPEDGPIPKEEKSRSRRLPAHESASNELYVHEVLALLSCFLFPMGGAYLLHTIRGNLSRPSEGLVSDYNLTIFLLAAELRPMAHLVKLIRARTLHLQRVVHSNPYDSIKAQGSSDTEDLLRRIEDLESRPSAPEGGIANSKPDPMNGKQTAVVTTEVRRTLQPEFDALNRAVRRYEKRATLQTMQTEARLHDLVARLADAITLAAAAAQQGQRGFGSVLVEWVAAGMVLPLQAFGALAQLPFKTIIAMIDFGKRIVVGKHPAERSRKNGTARYSHSRMSSDRLQAKGLKR